MFKNSIDQSPKFLSTPSVRRATFHGRNLLQRQAISIHALRKEGDLPALLRDVVAPPRFLSTPSARRATWNWNADC